MLIKSKLLEKLDITDDFWERFNAENKKLNKQVDLYEIENINNANLLTIPANPKEYFENTKIFQLIKNIKALTEIPKE